MIDTEIKNAMEYLVDADYLDFAKKYGLMSDEEYKQKRMDLYTTYLKNRMQLLRQGSLMATILRDSVHS